MVSGVRHMTRRYQVDLIVLALFPQLKPGKLVAGTLKSPNWKGKSASKISKLPFLDSMLIFQRVTRFQTIWA